MKNLKYRILDDIPLVKLADFLEFTAILFWGGRLKEKLDVVLEGLTCENSMKAEKSNAFGERIIEIPLLSLKKYIHSI